jgi:hypothetical protein
MLLKPTVSDGIALLLVALISGAAYYLAPQRRADLIVAPETGCDLQFKTCTARLPDGGHLALSILPRPIPVISPLLIEVRLVGLDAADMHIELTGVDMAMGQNRTQLTVAAPGIYRGTAMLPVCVSGKMKWQATVIFDAHATRIAVPFNFVSG